MEEQGARIVDVEHPRRKGVRPQPPHEDPDAPPDGDLNIDKEPEAQGGKQAPGDPQGEHKEDNKVQDVDDDKMDGADSRAPRTWNRK